MMGAKWAAIYYTPRYYGVIVYYLYTFLVYLIFTYGYMRLVPAIATVVIDPRVQRNTRPKMN